MSVIYMLQGSKHAVVLAVAIRSLRDHYEGPVTILAGDVTGRDYAGRIAADERLHVRVHAWAAPQGPRGTGYANKTHMGRLAAGLATGTGGTVFLDADTLVTGDIGDLLRVGPDEVLLTQFADWTTRSRHIAKRVKSWKGKVPPDWIDRCLDHHWPAINTGVLAWGENTAQWHETWAAITRRNITFICDEIAAQILLPHCDPDRVRVLPDWYNCSPIHATEETRTRHARVWHGHGFKFVRRPQGLAVWWPHYERAIDENVAGLRDWTPAGDKHLRRHLAAIANKATSHD